MEQFNENAKERIWESGQCFKMKGTPSVGVQLSCESTCLQLSSVNHISAASGVAYTKTRRCNQPLEID